MQDRTDVKIQNSAKNNFLSLYSSTTSIENAENVVKEPSNPIIKKYFKKYSEEILLSKLLTSIPIKKDPKMFTKIVLSGKLGKKNLKIIDDRYLKEDPTAPPIAT